MEHETIRFEGNIVDVISGEVFSGTIITSGGKIKEIVRGAVDEKSFLLPGLVDAHIHIESSLLIPSEFARLAAVHGTVATVSDPHEIANVLGVEGIRFMIRNGQKVPFRFYFGAPSCVPATPFESAGSKLGPEEVGELLEQPEIHYLAEMMNFPGVVAGEEEVIQKLSVAKRLGKPVDGHAPGLTGEALEKYIAAGITTDHECFSMEEAIEKIRLGMKILIREGSAARNFETLYPLIDRYPESVMLCSDDLHPDELVKGHIQLLVRRALQKGCSLMNVIRACTLNPVNHYHLDTGLLQAGDSADLIRVDSLEQFNVLETWINGRCTALSGVTQIPHVEDHPSNNFNSSAVRKEQLQIPVEAGRIRVITAVDGQLVTGAELFEPAVANGFVVSDTTRDILKIVVKERYKDQPPVVGFIRNFGLKAGALASSVAHDSHNIVAVGVDEQSLARAINLVIDQKGGLSFVSGEEEMMLALPFAGIMSGADGYSVAARYEKLDAMAKQAGCNLKSPYMTLSFMSLLVIPELKMSDLGLFSFSDFSTIPLFCV